MHAVSRMTVPEFQSRLCKLYGQPTLLAAVAGTKFIVLFLCINQAFLACVSRGVYLLFCRKIRSQHVTY